MPSKTSITALSLIFVSFVSIASVAPVLVISANFDETTLNQLAKIKIGNTDGRIFIFLIVSSIALVLLAPILLGASYGLDLSSCKHCSSCNKCKLLQKKLNHSSKSLCLIFGFFFLFLSSAATLASILLSEYFQTLKIQDMQIKIAVPNNMIDLSGTLEIPMSSQTVNQLKNIVPASDFVVMKQSPERAAAKALTPIIILIAVLIFACFIGSIVFAVKNRSKKSKGNGKKCHKCNHSIYGSNQRDRCHESKADRNLATVMAIFWSTTACGFLTGTIPSLSNIDKIRWSGYITIAAVTILPAIVLISSLSSNGAVGTAMAADGLVGLGFSCAIIGLIFHCRQSNEINESVLSVSMLAIACIFAVFSMALLMCGAWIAHKSSNDIPEIKRHDNHKITHHHAQRRNLNKEKNVTQPENKDVEHSTESQKKTNGKLLNNKGSAGHLQDQIEPKDQIEQDVQFDNQHNCLPASSLSHDSCSSSNISSKCT